MSLVVHRTTGEKIWFTQRDFGPSPITPNHPKMLESVEKQEPIVKWKIKADILPKVMKLSPSLANASKKEKDNIRYAVQLERSFYQKKCNRIRDFYQHFLKALTHLRDQTI